MRRVGWNPLAGIRAAGNGIANGVFTVTNQIEWLFAGTVDTVDTALRYLRLPGFHGSSSTAAFLWVNPFTSITITEQAWKAQTAHGGSGNLSLFVRIAGVNQATMTVAAGTATKTQAASVVVAQNVRCAMSHTTGASVTPGAQYGGQTWRIERAVP